MDKPKILSLRSARDGTQRRIAILGGCGHIGLPLGILLASRGATVTLIDKNPDRVAQVAAGRMPFVERGAEALLAETLKTKRLRPTTSLKSVARQDAVVVTIGTPVDEFLNPDVQQFDHTMNELPAYFRPGQLIILRSTVFPGTTERLGRRYTEQGLDLDIAYCPERIAQGYALDELVKLPQLIGGLTPTATARARALFEFLGSAVIEVRPVEAELSKLFANAYRYINFAISNQFYSIAEKFGADFNRVHAAVTADYPRMAGFARAGFAGGPCLLKDTMQLAAFNHNAFLLGQAAMMVNEGLPTMLVEGARTRYDLRNMKAAILGMAFKGNNDDIRDSLAFKLRKLLILECRQVLCTDVYIQDPSFVPLEKALHEADIFFVGALHDEYRNLQLKKPVIDAFGTLRSEKHENLSDGRRGIHRRVSDRGTTRTRTRTRRAG
ncbi:MAG: nucleotide sugar dehydrogenase [Pirellulales bacterium]|nr:nucleotide sugar dehydrogenase [Pirellulales bacterium]